MLIPHREQLFHLTDDEVINRLHAYDHILAQTEREIERARGKVKEYRQAILDVDDELAQRGLSHLARETK